MLVSELPSPPLVTTSFLFPQELRDISFINKKPIDRIRAIIRLRPLIIEKQTNTLNW